MLKSNMLKDVPPSLQWALLVILSLFFIELIIILAKNNGLLVYTLDDPYIHLSLAENIFQGWYGVNKNELSAPSSSILWPILLSPFAASTWAPAIINVLCTATTLFILNKIVELCFNRTDFLSTQGLQFLILLTFILSTNSIGLVFLGMEHSLQVLSAVVIAYGMIIITEQKLAPIWLPMAIALAPLVRYEGMAISLPAISFLILSGYARQAIYSTLLTMVPLLIFSSFLFFSDLGIFPTSIEAKSAIVDTHGSLSAFTTNVRENVSEQSALKIMAGATFLSILVWIERDRARTTMAICVVAAVVLHLIFGDFGWYHRYEIYIWSFLLACSLYLLTSHITRHSIYKSNRNIAIGLLCFIQVIILFSSNEYIRSLSTIPQASNNIYQQQAQLNRFVVDYYKKPVGINDLGYVSYQNQNYTLDFVGLASKEVLDARTKGINKDWMATITENKNVELAMIYGEWFWEHLPNEWKKIGSLNFNGPLVTPAFKSVDFYATKIDSVEEITKTLKKFIPSLPEGVNFYFAADID